MPHPDRQAVPTSEPVATEPTEALESLSEIERRHILKALEVCRGQRALAARVLGVDRKTLYRRLRAYGY